MVQERDSKPQKVQEADLDRPVPPRDYSRDSSATTDMASGLALLLSVIAFFFSAYAVIQAVSTRRSVEEPQPNREQPGRQSGGGGSFAQPISRPLLPQIGPYRFQRVEPGQFTQPAYGGAGEVELLSATRDTAGSDVVNVRLRVVRLSQPLETPGEINLSRTLAVNTRTNGSYPLISSQTPGDQVILLSNLRSGESTEATVSLRLPPEVDRLDIEFPGTRVFRSVPIAMGNS
jgi:hypothetical protein